MFVFGGVVTGGFVFLCTTARACDNVIPSDFPSLYVVHSPGSKFHLKWPKKL